MLYCYYKIKVTFTHTLFKIQIWFEFAARPLTCSGCLSQQHRLPLSMDTINPIFK